MNRTKSNLANIYFGLVPFLITPSRSLQTLIHWTWTRFDLLSLLHLCIRHLSRSSFKKQRRFRSLTHNCVYIPNNPPPSNRPASTPFVGPANSKAKTTRKRSQGRPKHLVEERHSKQKKSLLFYIARFSFVFYCVKSVTGRRNISKPQL